MKVAIVTGASRGIGKAVALGLAKDGFNLALIARSKDSLFELKNLICQQYKIDPACILTMPIDVQDEKAVAKSVSEVISKFGRIDVLFNNAGIGKVGSVDVSEKEFEEVLRINLFGAFYFLKSVVPVMKQQKTGLIINVASRAGKIGFAHYGTYGASKFGLVGLSESLYHELTPLGIKVTALCPSWVDTDMAQHSGLDSHEMIQPDDIMKTINWLLTLSPAACVKEIMIECRDQTA
jgi:3-oxoacyl-[acyl-carrier protein] reductase